MQKLKQYIDHRIVIFCNFAMLFRCFLSKITDNQVIRKDNPYKMRQLKIQKSITNRSSEALDKYLVEIG